MGLHGRSSMTETTKCIKEYIYISLFKFEFEHLLIEFLNMSVYHDLYESTTILYTVALLYS